MRDAGPLSFPKPSNCLAWLATSACVTVWWLKFWRLTAWSQFCAWGLPCLQTLILWLCWDLWAKEMGQHQRALVCHSMSDPATFSFSKVSHACLSPALCNLPSCCVCRATACDHDILHCCTTYPVHLMDSSREDLKPLLTFLLCENGWGLLLQCWSWIILVPLLIYCVCGQSSVHAEHLLCCILRWFHPGAVSIPLCDPWWSLKGSLAASGWKVL